MYAKISNGQVDAYPVFLEDLRSAQTCLPARPSAAQLAEIGVFQVSLVGQPFALGYEYAEGTPVLVDGVWTQTWVGKALSAESAAAQAAQYRQQIVAEVTATVQGRLDSFASTRGYDGILSACSYVASKVPRFATEANYCVDARDATWAKLYEILARVESGNWPTEGAGQMPTSYADIEPELPALEWP